MIRRKVVCKKTHTQPFEKETTVSRRLDTRLPKPSIATVLGMLLVFVAFANASGQDATRGEAPIEPEPGTGESP
jgi:hypothetical protein